MEIQFVRGYKKKKKGEMEIVFRRWRFIFSTGP